jgi:hypothetical protein
MRIGRIRAGFDPERGGGERQVVDRREGQLQGEEGDTVTLIVSPDEHEVFVITR